MLHLEQKVGTTVQNPEADFKVLFLDDNGTLTLKDSVGTIETLYTAEQAASVAATRPLVYKALLTQTSTNAPVATVVENTLEDDLVWAYSAEGVYTGTLTGAFTNNHTLLILNSNTVAAVRTSADVITLTGASNGLLTGTTFIIEVYPQLA